MMITADRDAMSKRVSQEWLVVLGRYFCVKAHLDVTSFLLPFLAVSTQVHTERKWRPYSRSIDM